MTTPLYFFILFRFIMEEIGFATFDPNTKNYVQSVIQKKDLEQFPGSLFTLITKTSGAFKTPYNDEIRAFIVSIDPKMLDHVAYFYKTKYWKNPHIRENKLSAIELDQITEYMNLPNDIEEAEDIEEECDDDDYDYYADISDSDEDWDPSLHDDRFDDDGLIDYGYDPNPYGHT